MKRRYVNIWITVLVLFLIAAACYGFFVGGGFYRVVHDYAQDRFGFERIRLGPVAWKSWAMPWSFTVNGIEVHNLRSPAIRLVAARQVDVDGPSIIIRDAHLEGLGILSRPHEIDIQSLKVVWPFQIGNFRGLENGRLRFGKSDTVLVRGALKEGRLHFDLYSKSVDLSDIFDLLDLEGPLRRVSGVIEDADIFADLEPAQTVVTGKLKLSRLFYRGFTLKDGDVDAIHLRISSANGKISLKGDVRYISATLRRGKTEIVLEPGTIRFEGDPQAPILDLRGISRIGATSIRIELSGPMVKPELKLRSSPPAPEEKILVMLATGREWSASEMAVKEGRLTTDAAREFVDYFVFGGSGSEIARRFGIKEISLDLTDRSRGIGITKEIAKAIDVRYGVQQSRAQGAAASQKAGIDYRIQPDTTVSVEGEKSSQGPRDDRVQVQLKKNF